MKRIISLLLVCAIIFTCSLMFVGCDNKFKPVKSITFTFNGNEVTKRSSWSRHFGSAVYVTEKEYNNSPSNKRLSNIERSGQLTEYSIPKDANSKISYSKKEEKLMENGNYYYKYTLVSLGSYSYFYLAYLYTSYSYVLVNIINDSTIQIWDSKGKTTYNVTSYRVSYMD